MEDWLGWDTHSQLLSLLAQLLVNFVIVRMKASTLHSSFDLPEKKKKRMTDVISWFGTASPRVRSPPR